MRRIAFPERAYRLAMAILPPDFRERYADEMVDFARARLRAARDIGRAAVIRESASLVADLARSAPSLWLEERPFAVTPPQRDDMDILMQDVKFGVRSLLRRPAFTVVAALTLALGIGANTAIFSLVNAVLIRPLPYKDPGRLVLVWGTQGSQNNQGVVYADYVDWRRQNHTFEEIGALRGQSVNLTGAATPDRLIGTFVSASALRAFGARVEQGRIFTDRETELATMAPVALISHETWATRFGADAGILGRQIVINGTSFTVIGVLAPRMPTPMFSETPDVMVPIGYYPNAHGLDRGTRGIAVVGRLKPGVTIDAAQRDLQAIEQELARTYPTTNAGTSAEVVSLRDYTVGPTKAPLYILLAAVAAVLLIACANVANLQLARGASRARELSVRAALGAGRMRIARQLLTESVMLSLVGGVSGAGLAFVMTKGLVALLAPLMPVYPDTIRVDGVVLLFALVVSLATGILFGLPPAWKASRTRLTETLRTRIGGGLHVRTRNSLVVVQLALSLALLASAGLLTRSLLALEHVDPGFDGENLLTAQFRLSPSKYDSPDKIWSMFERTIAEIRALPGVESAALVRASPLSGNGESYPALVEGRPAPKPGEAPLVVVDPVTTDYFSTMRIPLLAGRDVATTDRTGTLPVVLVNRSFAERTWPGESPVGKRIKFGDDDWRTVIGEVGDTRHYSLNESQLLEAYIPYAQRPQIFTSLVVRTRGTPTDMVKPVQQAIWRVDRDQPVWRFRSMERDLAAVVSSSKVAMLLIGLFALVALLVAVVGIYGVLSYTMAQRTHEVGIRIALGADAGRVRRMVIGEGLRLIGVAVAIGLVASLGAARLLRSQLYGVAPHDVVTFVVVSVALAGVALVACYLPARRASRVDPMVALRSE
jgi:putative ABC transport system permease protein